MSDDTENVAGAPDDVANNFLDFTSPAVAEFWNDFCDSGSAPKDDISYAGEMHFEARGFLNDELLTLVLLGKKTAIFESLASHLVDNEPLPVNGEFYVVVDRAENPRCIIELESVNIVPFAEITWEMAERDGTDGNLDAWRQRMTEQLEDEADFIGYEVTPDLKLVFQTFRIAYRKLKSEK